jgi:hypothetical protein
MLKFVIALVVVIASVQCAAACTPVATAQPPCHHHKQAPSCSHELVPATIVPSTVVDVTFSSEAIPLVSLTFASTDTSTPIDPSPPGPPVAPPTILRI